MCWALGPAWRGCGNLHGSSAALACVLRDASVRWRQVDALALLSRRRLASCFCSNNINEGAQRVP